MLKPLTLFAAAAAALSLPAFAADEAPAAGGAPADAAAAARTQDPYAANIVRLSKISVDPAQVDAYKAFAAEVGRESMRLEPGVRVLYSVQEKERPTEFAILEIYASEEAYRRHIQTAHFKKYKEGTRLMVKKLELIDCHALVPEALIKPMR